MTTKETFSLHGENLLKTIKELIAEGNVTRITINDKSCRELLSFPLTIGVVAAIFAPVFAAVGALAAFVSECTITVEREIIEVADNEIKSDHV
ncbi:DUF4342 domain-containing protein [Mucilaginibacter sp.]|uniref:DUF4342 domain-containing protein n=1 Tax=Mucilaginibacter sp. TaxID=1882438 RepID=UPI0035BC01DF